MITLIAVNSQKAWTLKEERFLKENYGRLNINEIAEHLGRSYSSVRNRLGLLGITLNLQQREYAVYKGNKLLVIGTLEECAAEMSVTEEYIYWLTTPTGKKRAANRQNPEKATTAVRLDSDEDE